MHAHNRDKQTIIDSERAFHDQLFQHGFEGNERAVADKYYSTNQAARKQYRASIVQRCTRATVLEYGCGPHGMVFDILKAGAQHGEGIDISSAAIQHSSSKAAQQGLGSRLTFHVMDAEHLDFDDNSFDIVFGSGILHHLSLDRSLPEIARVLKPSGTAVFLEPLGHNPFINLYRRLTPRLRTPDEHPLTISDLRFITSFFTQPTLQYYGLINLLLSPLVSAPFFQAALSAAEAVDSALFRIPFVRRYAWTVVMTLSNPTKKLHTA